MPDLAELSKYVPAIAVATFGAVYLGGLALSFTWKWFGPWKMLEAARAECAQCHAERERDSKERALLAAEVADVKARYEIVMKAVENGGLGLRLTTTRQ